MEKENPTQETSSLESKATKEFQEDVDKLKPIDDLFKQKDTGTPEIKVSEEKKYSDIAKEIASSIREYISVYISLADAKAGILIGVDSGLLAAFYFHGPKLFQKSFNIWGVLDVISFLGYLFLVGGIYSALLVVWPRTSSVKQKGLISWIHVSNYDKVEAYIQDIFSANESQIVENLYRLNYDLAVICKRKYHWLSSAFKLTVIGCIISIVVFIVISRLGI